MDVQNNLIANIGVRGGMQEDNCPPNNLSKGN